jgi:hypothetical protein
VKPPLTRSERRTILAAVFAASCLIGACAGTLVAGCGASASVVTPAAYGAELQACVHDGATREAVDACRRAVDARYGQLDAGGGK